MYLITNRSLCEQSRYLEILKEASFNGINYIVLREKDLSYIELKELYIQIKRIINIDTKVIINNNFDVYKDVNADGIHLSYCSFMELNNYNEFKDKILGVSVHTIEEVESIKNTNIDYIFFSHIYKTKCKEGIKPKGLELLVKVNEILQDSNIKLVALGGILPNNYAETIKYCDDVAIMSNIMKSSNVKNTIYEYINR